MSKYPIDLIEADFVQKRMTFSELIKKYEVKKAFLAYHSGRKNWVKRRKEFTTKTQAEVMEKGIEQGAKEEFNLLEAIDKLIKLKTTLEIKVFSSEVDKAITTGKSDNKLIMYLLNKSKDNIGDLTKVSELLKGNATDRVEVTEQEKALRYNRLREQMVEN